MAKTFDAAVRLIRRIPDEETTKYLFRSLLSYLHPDDQELVVEDLLETITQTTNEQKCA